MIKTVSPSKPESHPDIIEALRRALEMAHNTPLEYISINLRISEKAHCVIDAYPGE